MRPQRQSRRGPPKGKVSRRDAIMDVGIELAEAGGYDNVRQREVAERAGIALGTLYKSFRSKEDILVAALARGAQETEDRLVAHPPRGRTPAARVAALFADLTSTMLARPHFARAVIRAMASGEPEVAGNIASYYGRMSGLVVAALRGKAVLGDDDDAPSDAELTVASLLLQIWFSSLVGWSAGLTDEQGVGARVGGAVDILLRGVAEKKKERNK
ncbi:MAG: TetR/AcrR family transcriptional regulator [Polyangiaceae bacterium]|nr:TetR/AcrR family transcriptional regulator [Polyangiaceae bacterium]